VTTDKQRGTLGAIRQKIARLRETLEKAMNGKANERKQKGETNTGRNKRRDKQIGSAPTNPDISAPTLRPGARPTVVGSDDVHPDSRRE